jgi:hypothetical protein
LVTFALAQQVGATAPDLGARVDHLVRCVDARWTLVGTAGDDVDRIHRWRRINEIMTVQVRQFDTALDALRHVKDIVGALAVPIEETLKIGSFAALIEWGDGRSTVYLSVGKTAVVISAPSSELAKRLTRQAALEFSDPPLQQRSAQR